MTALEEMMVRPDFIFVDMNMPVMNGRQSRNGHRR